MGDPRKHRKKFDTPNHPWERARIEEEGKLVKAFGFKKKKEIWKTQSLLRKIKKQAKDLIRRTDDEAKKQQEVLMKKLVKIGLFEAPVEVEKILDLPIESMIKRRLQTVVYDQGLANSVKQSRQWITHGHITISDKVINVPSYMVKKEEESKIAFKISSPFKDEDHPERVKKIEAEKKKAEIKKEIEVKQKEEQKAEEGAEATPVIVTETPEKKRGKKGETKE